MSCIAPSLVAQLYQVKKESLVKSGLINMWCWWRVGRCSAGCISPLLSCQLSSALYCSSMMEARQPYCSAAESALTGCCPPSLQLVSTSHLARSSETLTPLASLPTPSRSREGELIQLIFIVFGLWSVWCGGGVVTFDRISQEAGLNIIQNTYPGGSRYSYTSNHNTTISNSSNVSLLS